MNISNELLFLLLNAKMAFISDISLNFFANSNILSLKNTKFYNSIKTLIPYFSNKTVFVAAFYAMMTVLIILVIITELFNLLYDKYLPEENEEYIMYFIITFIVGYFSDIIIYKINIFPKLQLYYRVVGKGLWGALAILFSVISSFIYLYILKYMGWIKQ